MKSIDVKSQTHTNFSKKNNQKDSEFITEDHM